MSFPLPFGSRSSAVRSATNSTTGTAAPFHVQMRWKESPYRPLGPHASRCRGGADWERAPFSSMCLAAFEPRAAKTSAPIETQHSHYKSSGYPNTRLNLLPRAAVILSAETAIVVASTSAFQCQQPRATTSIRSVSVPDRSTRRRTSWRPADAASVRGPVLAGRLLPHPHSSGPDPNPRTRGYDHDPGPREGGQLWQTSCSLAIHFLPTARSSGGQGPITRSSSAHVRYPTAPTRPWERWTSSRTQEPVVGR